MLGIIFFSQKKLTNIFIFKIDKYLYITNMTLLSRLGQELEYQREF